MNLQFELRSPELGVCVIREAHGLSERRACGLVGIKRSRCRYAAGRPERVGLRGRLREQRGLPQILVTDHGPEFAGQALDVWADERGVKLRFIEPGKPVQNAYLESFNGKRRDEGLNEHWFLRLGEARETIEAWRRDYHEVRPHSALGNRTPQEFTACGAPLRSPTAPFEVHRREEQKQETTPELAL